MEKRVSQFIKDNKLNIDNTVICAVSGGADSVVLLYILYKLGYNVVLAHVNHHKRLQSELEEKAMKDLASKMNIPFELLAYHYNGLDNFHNDSHHARYDFFRSLCKKYNTNIIATAHHSDDQIETVLMKIMEGSNLYGYGGINVCNNDGEFRIIRPLLCVSKEEIYDYAKKNSLITFEDSSNHEDDFLRNRLRHHVVPLLKNEANDLNEKIVEYSTQLHEAFAFIRGISIDYLNKTHNTIEFNSFNKLNIAVKKDIISLLLERYNINKTYSLINDIIGFVSKNNGTKSLVLADGYRLNRVYDISKIEQAINKERKKVLLGLDDVVIYDDKYKAYFSKNVTGINAKYISLCYNKLKLPLVIRSKMDGDEITTLVGTKKLSRVFIDYKIGKIYRDSVPVITDSANQILWVYDLIKSKSVFEQKNDGDIYLVIEVLKNEK